MPSKDIRLTWNANYALRACEQPKELVILLHGWQQHGRAALHIFGDLFGPDSYVIAPDGPYPVPFATKRGLRPAYGWYMFDSATSEYLVPMDFGVNYVAKLVEELGLGHLPTRILGFSMGGYLAPFVGLALDKVSQVVAVNSRYRSEVINEILPFRVDAVHGDRDESVDVARARQCHEDVIQLGNRGYFHEVEDCGHMPSENLLRATREILALGNLA